MILFGIGKPIYGIHKTNLDHIHLPTNESKRYKTVLYNLHNSYFMIKYSAFVPSLQGSFLNFSLVKVGLDDPSKAVKLDQKESQIKIM